MATTWKLEASAKIDGVSYADACAKLAGHFRRVSEGNAEMTDICTVGTIAVQPSVLTSNDKGSAPVAGAKKKGK
jgi:hypothetical protein|tara:strand:+ start:6055 stop:6276 length:222 start_codon:yes stop_codon:yes gene_type:complete